MCGRDKTLHPNQTCGCVVIILDEGCMDLVYKAHNLYAILVHHLPLCNYVPS